MTRKDYIRFADALHDAFPPTHPNTFLGIAFQSGYQLAIEVICNVFKQDNPNFNKDKFLAAIKDDLI